MAVVPATRAGFPFESGDRLTRAEFHRCYEDYDGPGKAELVEGVVYVSPSLSRAHGRPHALIMGWLTTYWGQHPEVETDDNTTVFLDGDNEVQPDACMWFETERGPRTTDDLYIEGAPQLVVEIAASSASYDLHDKLRAYQRAGVREYIVWRTRDSAVDWFRLHEGAFRRVEPDPDGIIASEAFPGLRLHVPALLAGNLALVQATTHVPPTKQGND